MKCGHPVEGGGGTLEQQNWERVIFSITLLTRIGQRAQAVLRTNDGTDAACVLACGSPSEFIALFFPYLSSSQYRQQNIYCVSNSRQQGMERHREAGSWL